MTANSNYGHIRLISSATLIQPKDGILFTDIFITRCLTDIRNLLPDDILQEPVGRTLLEFANATQELLKRWLDEWLDSGIMEDGSEIPSRRAMSKERSLKGEGFEFALLEFSCKNMWIDVDPTSGQPCVEISRVELEGGDPGTLMPRANAEWNLAQCMLSPIRFHLAKCRQPGCGRYFSLSQINRTYWGGTLCPAHTRERRKQQSVGIVAGQRKDAAEELYKRAAAHFNTRLIGSWHLDKRLKALMVRFINREIEKDSDLRRHYTRGTRVGITPSWLTRDENRDGIQAALDLHQNPPNAKRVRRAK